MTNKEKLENAAKRLADQVIESIQQGKGATWLKPWHGGECQNLYSDKPYSGYNTVWTQIYNAVHGYESQFFVTANKLFAMAKERKQRIVIDNPKRLLTITFYKPIIKNQGEENEEKFFVLQTYNVYNVEQVENYKEFFGNDLTKLDTIEKPKPIIEIDQYFNQYLDNQNISIKFGGDRACYIPSMDALRMPKIGQFVGEAEYYSTLAHEIAHTTGPRLGRFKADDPIKFGDDVYSEEELVAEFTATMYGQHFNISCDSTLRNSEAYLIGWAKKFKAEPMIILNSIKKASKAFEFVEKCVFEQSQIKVSA